MYFYYGTVEFTGNHVENNYAGEDGAGVYFSISNSPIEDNLFEGNTQDLMTDGDLAVPDEAMAIPDLPEFD